MPPRVRQAYKSPSALFAVNFSMLEILFLWSLGEQTEEAGSSKVFAVCVCVCVGNTVQTVAHNLVDSLCSIKVHVQVWFKMG